MDGGVDSWRGKGRNVDWDGDFVKTGGGGESARPAGLWNAEIPLSAHGNAFPNIPGSLYLLLSIGLPNLILSLFLILTPVCWTQMTGSDSWPG